MNKCDLVQLSIAGICVTCRVKNCGSCSDCVICIGRSAALFTFGCRPLKEMFPGALVTGSTSGIGLAVAQGLAKMGMNVMLNGFGTKEEIDGAIEAVKQSARSPDQKILFTAADLSKANEVEGLVRATASQFNEGLSVLVNNAGIQHVSPVEDFPAEQWDKIIAVNLSAVFHTTRHAIPIMKRQQFGRIINIASVHGLVGSVNKSAYVAAKHGVIGFTKSVALETAQTGITCNAICPGWVYTPLVEKQVQLRMSETGMSWDDAAESLIGEKMPSKAFVTVEEVAAACSYFALPTTKGCTGSILTIDGGWTSQ